MTTWTNKKIVEIVKKHGTKCFYCKGDAHDSSDYKGFQIDHVYPRSLGGSNDINNLVPCCRRCNVAKGTKTIDEWEKLLKIKSKLIKRVLKSIKELKDGKKKND